MAQEPAQSKQKSIKLEYGKDVCIAMLNVTTLATLGQRQAIEKWMRENRIDFLGMQETKLENYSMENRKGFILYFSRITRPDPSVHISYRHSYL